MNEQEIIRRLVLIDRKLNYIAGLSIAGAALMAAILAFFVARFLLSGFSWKNLAALIIAFAVGSATGRYVERPFRRADP